MSDHLMQFRLAYLRAISKAWRNPTFCEELLKSQNAFDILAQDFNFQSPWPYLTFRLLKNDSRWAPVLTGNWIGPKCPEDQFHIYLPMKRAVQAGDELEALTNYYQLFPTLFGPLHPVDCPHTGAGEAGSLANLGASSNVFLDFGGTVFDALSLSWQAPQFQEELTEEKSGIPALTRYLRFNNPWNFNIVFSFSDKFIWSSSSKRWIDAPSNRIELAFPNPPEDEGVWPLALTAYNNSGPQYPFTCI